MTRSSSPRHRRIPGGASAASSPPRPRCVLKRECVRNIPAKAGGIPEGALPEGTVSGTANVGRGNYFGPGAPAGPRYHHYIFELCALSKMLDLPVDATRAQLLDAMKDVVVAKAAYVGRFRQ